jgi:Cu2+-exporting ATPase/Cu+-exporting ATPase
MITKDGWKLLIICFLLALYVVGLIYMKTADTQEDKLKRARYHVETRLKKRGGHRASFDAIRNRMGNMDSLIALGTSAAWIYSAFVTFFHHLSS